MDTEPAADQLDDLPALPRDTYRHIAQRLIASLPPPPLDTPEARDRRDQDAIAALAALHPANAEEIHLAALHVAAGAEALESLRLSRDPDITPAQRITHIRQASSMMREARALHALLARVQADRQKRQANPTALGHATIIERCAVGLMTEALGEVPPPAPTAPSPPDPIAEAEHYARHHRKRASLIRRLGRLPEKIPIGPMRPEVVEALISGTTPTLRALAA